MTPVTTNQIISTQGDTRLSAMETSESPEARAAAEKFRIFAADLTTGTIEGAVADSVEFSDGPHDEGYGIQHSPMHGLYLDYLDEDEENTGYAVEELLTPEWAVQVTAACEKVEA